ncbi:MAG: nucleotidyltransferase domain-containing protein [Nitrospirae bacterium]|nr:nucleotidyltransferase domain-containing protein [Nitrospirota bacterium]MCL5978897.1 nucleotidyltransferase domain-containing protein [Nitrospirota bacterium]
MENLFSTSERIKILEAVIFRTGSVSVNNIASQLGLSKGLVSKYFQILLKEQILKKEKGKLVVADSTSVKAVKILLTVKRIDTRIFDKYPFVTAVGLYGSCARGENTEDSDVDLWVKIKDVEETKIASLTSEMNKKIKNAKLLFLSDKKIEKLRKEDIMFYHSLSFGSIILYGDKDAASV